MLHIQHSRSVSIDPVWTSGHRLLQLSAQLSSPIQGADSRVNWINVSFILHILVLQKNTYLNIAGVHINIWQQSVLRE